MADFEKDGAGTVDPETAELERRLREGLRRVEAPTGFTERVMERAEAAERRREGRAGREGWWRSVAAVLLLGLAAGGWMVQRERTERMDARETKEQFAVAMRVTARVTERSFAKAQRSIGRVEAVSKRTEAGEGEAR